MNAAARLLHTRIGAAGAVISATARGGARPRLKQLLCAAALAFSLSGQTPAHAQQVVRIGLGVGTTYLPLQVMIDRKLLEKHATAGGVTGLKVEVSTIGSANAMNDALLSGSLDLASGGSSTFMPLWEKTKKTLGIKAIGALGAMPMYLVTTNPSVKSIKDFTDKDRIAIAGLKVSYQAIILQMAAAQAFGDAQYDRLDRLAIARSNSDGLIALLKGGEVTAHLSPPPFSTQELRDPRSHMVLSSYDVLGGPATLTLVWGASAFRDKNRAVYDAFVAALREAQNAINADLPAAAASYLRVSGDKSNTAQAILEVIGAKGVQWTVVPTGTLKVAQFMKKVGTIKDSPADWKELFFPEAHGGAGS